MLISDAIAKLIEEMLSETSTGSLEIQRNNLAERIGCVPSQINYVITSRFTPERGYIVESRRGGGGYIRITRKQMQKNEYLMHFIYAIGDELDQKTSVAFIKNLHENSLITDREAKISAAALKYTPDNISRANIMRQIILAIME